MHKLVDLSALDGLSELQVLVRHRRKQQDQLSTLYDVGASFSCSDNEVELSSIELTLGQEAVPQGDHGPGVDL